MPETKTPEQVLIERLQRKVEAQSKTIDSLMDNLEERQAGTEATPFQIWSQNVQLEEVLKRKTESLEQGLRENQELNQSLQTSQQFLNAVIDTIPARICILDETGLVIKVNQEWQEQGNDGNYIAVGDHLESKYRGFYLQIGKSPDLPDAIGTIVRGEHASYSENTHFQATHFQTQIARIQGTSHTLIAHTDITTLVETQLELEDERKQNQLLSLVAKHTANGIIIMSSDGTVEWRNRVYEDILDFEVEGLTGLELLNRLVKDPAEIQNIADHLQNRSEFHSDVKIYGVDGEEHFMNIEFRPTAPVNGAEKLIMIATDVTERVLNVRALSNERQIFENVISNVPHGVYWKDREGRYLGCNDAYSNQLNLPNRDAVVGKTDADFQFPADKLASQTKYEESVLTTGIPVLGIEEKYTTQPAVAHMLTSRVPLRDETGEVSGVLGIFADITSVKSMEDQLNQARRLEAIGQLSAGIAHEINTPMQYIGDNIQFLERASSMLIQIGEQVEKLGKDHEDEDLRNMIGNWLRVGRFDQLRSRVPTAITSAKEGVVVVSQIVQAMKAFAHPGDRELKLADLNSAITNTITVSRNEWKYVAEIDTEFADFCAVKCNLGELNQVFLNIIVNAAHAISDTLDDTRRMGRIKISTHDDVDHIEVRIADDGTGMPEEVRARIFEQFFTTKAVGSGTGQGLALAHAVIVDRHKGTINVDSAPGQGTTFRIRIPKATEQAEAA